MLKDYVALTKPGIIRLNAFAAFGGFWVASKWHIDLLLLVYMLIGSALTMASACVINNYWDRELDKKMERTKNRALPTNRMKPTGVLIYGIVLGVIGITMLFVLVNKPSGWLGLLGMFVYIVVYTMWLKRTSTWSTSIGGVSGAMPPVIGYCAVTGHVDAGAWILFALLFLWQPAHFWSLAIRRVEEYRAAGYPLLPVVKGIGRTKLQMIPYILLLIPTGILMFTYDYVGYFFLVISLIGGVLWLVHTLMGLKAKDDDKWAKTNFIISINYLMVVFFVMVLDTNGIG
ncbi:protoheme IX farnesyltransferase 1 [Paenibacillus baekrokdamisoli]|uniref:Protoheme IX farnesyltransferase n=1 Tax=Paenibacillus baekrokdamisoli TaxID=1712516 RepID=A0A3G9JFF2_9BACL|nr:heme o synthase [Paenibacillus baekrokdamisoli]MBB3073074.1 protoheme IX farnesyltransferase [Paenibacillus baekrokdamisoli]BBH21689.1 protoheme IX farnesyltransferase 1 [Paenibacillus baekrokdamisoli]